VHPLLTAAAKSWMHKKIGRNYAPVLYRGSVYESL